MIHNLSYSVTFPTNGISLTGRFAPPPGITSVTGRNGAGKSFMASEMVRYMLFGKKALRGPASDYRNLAGTLDVTIGDKRIVVERGKAERITDTAGNTIAVGTDAVNKLLAAEMGFGLQVFDLVCACNQKESDQLTQMRPADRKRMIDDVIGLNTIESVERLCREEAKQSRRDADAIRDAITIAVPPIEPNHYRPSDDIGEQLRQANDTERRRRELQLAIAGVGPKPSEPPPQICSIPDLEDYEAERLRLDARRRSLSDSIAHIPSVDVSAELLDIEEKWIAYHEELRRRGPAPTMSAYAIDQGLAGHATHDAWTQTASVEVECPRCRHQFNTAGAEPPVPTVSRAQLHEEMQRLAAWATPLMPPNGVRIGLNRQAINASRIALDRQSERIAIVAELDVLPQLTNKSSELAKARELQAEWRQFDRAYADWSVRSAAADCAMVELSALAPPMDIEALSEAYTAARVFEAQQASFAAAQQEGDRLTNLANQKIARAEAFNAGAAALASARASFKAHLAPTWGRMASALIYQMTGGALSQVAIDDALNITVDGQDVSTLSGSGSTVANLALRLALGQVLVSKVFPVFIGDEIDACMDADRAQQTAEALGSLRNLVKQIILISHKDIDIADQRVTVVDGCDEPIN